MKPKPKSPSELSLPEHPKIEEVELGGDNIGLCDFNKGTIYLQVGLSPPTRLTTLCHELIHYALPEFCGAEDKIEHIEGVLFKGLWEQGYRKVDV